MTEINVGDKVRYTGENTHGHPSWERRKHTDSLVLEVGETVLTVWDFEGEDTFFTTPENLRVSAVASYEAVTPPAPVYQDGDAMLLAKATDPSRIGRVAVREDGGWHWAGGPGTWTDDITTMNLRAGVYTALRVAGRAVS